MAGYITTNIGSATRYRATTPEAVQDLKLEYIRMTNTLDYACDRLKQLYTYKGEAVLWAGLADGIEETTLSVLPGGQYLTRGVRSKIASPDVNVRHLQHEIVTRLRNNEIIVPSILLHLYDQKIKEFEHDIVQFQERSIERAEHQKTVIEITIDVLTVIATAGAGSLLKEIGFLGKFAELGKAASRLAGTVRMTLAGAGINLVRNFSELGGKIAVGLETEWTPGITNILLRLNFDLTVGFFVSFFSEMGFERVNAYLSGQLGKFLSDKTQELVTERLQSFFVNRSTECSWAFLNSIFNSAANPKTQQDIKQEIFEQLGLEKWLVDAI